MNCPLFLRSFYFLQLFVSTAFIVHGQNLTNMQIGVSAEMLTVLKFSSPVTRYEFENKNSNYSCQLREDNSLVIKAVSDTAVTTDLHVNEGEREHLFKVVFVPVADLNRTRFWYDFSNLRILKKLADDQSQNTITKSIPDEQRSLENVNATEATTKETIKPVNALSTIPKLYSQAELWLKYHEKYPNLVFDLPPEGQYLAGDYAIPHDTLENARVSYLILEDTPKMQQSSDTFNDINFVLQGIYFSNTNCYMRILIQNKSVDDYMVGAMNLTWYSDSGKIYNAYPCFITSYPSRGIWTSFPVMPAGTEETIVLTTRSLNVKEADSLSLTIGDRLNKVNLQLTIPAREYLTTMEAAK